MTVISSIEKSNGLAERKVMKGILKKGLSLALVMITSSFASSAFAQNGSATPSGGDPFGNVTSVVCGVADALQGPVGIGVGLLVLAAGLIMMQLANRDAIPMISRAVIGTALLIGGTAAFTALITAPQCQ
jgi:hypothetical protein